MVQAQQPHDDNRNMHQDDRKCDRVPARQHQLLELQVWLLAPGENALRVARRAHGRLNEGAEVPTACELVLDAQVPGRPEAAQPLSVDLALDVKVHWWWAMYSGVTRRMKQSQSMGNVVPQVTQVFPIRQPNNVT